MNQEKNQEKNDPWRGIETLAALIGSYIVICDVFGVKLTTMAELAEFLWR